MDYLASYGGRWITWLFVKSDGLPGYLLKQMDYLVICEVRWITWLFVKADGLPGYL